MKKSFKKVVGIILAAAMSITSISLVSANDSVKPMADDAVVTHVVDDGTRDIDFNGGWKFYLATREPEEAEGGFATNGVADAGEYTTLEVIDPTFDDSSWRTLTLPHDFSIEGEKVSNSSNAQAYLEGGLGYYRKTFTVP